MRIEDLKAFVTLADVSSFHVAAELLNITQPALTRRIQKIERLLDTQLFIRSTRNVRLTSEGISFLERVRTIVADIETALLEMHQSGSERAGLIRIGCLPSIGMKLLPEAIKVTNAIFPKVAYRILDGNALDVIQMVVNSQVDVGIGMRLGDESNLRFTFLFEEPIGVMCSRDSAIANRKYLTWSELADSPWVYNLEESGNRLVIEKSLIKHKTSLNWAHQIKSLTGAMIIVRGGNAIAPVPQSFSATLESTDLAFRSVKSPTITRRIYLIERTESVRSSYLEKFINFIEMKQC